MSIQAELSNDRVEAMRSALREAAPTWGESGEVRLETDRSYGGTAPVAVRIRKRGHRYDLCDDAAAVAAAGRPSGWLAVAERAVAEAHLNVNRRGVVFVPAVEGRDLAALACKVAAASAAVYSALLEL